MVEKKVHASCWPIILHSRFYSVIIFKITDVSNTAKMLPHQSQIRQTYISTPMIHMMLQIADTKAPQQYIYTQPTPITNLQDHCFFRDNSHGTSETLPIFCRKRDLHIGPKTQMVWSRRRDRFAHNTGCCHFCTNGVYVYFSIYIYIHVFIISIHLDIFIIYNYYIIHLFI